MFLASQSPAADLYSLTALSNSLGGSGITGYGMNNLAQIVGYEAGPSDNFTTAYVWSPQQGVQTLTPLTAGYTSYADDINDSGLIAGRSTVLAPYSNLEPTIWHTSAPGSPTALIINNCSSCGGPASSVNNAPVAQVAGTNDGQAYLWNEGDATLSLLGLSGIVEDVNDAGVITGYTIGSPYEPFIWDIGGGQSQPQLLTDQLGAQAVAINNSNQVVGRYATIDGYINQGFIWDAANGFRGLDPLHEYGLIFPTDINNNGQVVGYLSDLFGQSHGFLWTASDGIKLIGDMVDPNDPYYNPNADIIWEAFAINDNGQIAAESRDYQHVFLFTPTAVPAPPALWLFGTGLLGMIGIARRQKAV